MPWILRKASPGKNSNLRPGYCTAGCMGFWLGLAAGWVFWAEFGALVFLFDGEGYIFAGVPVVDELMDVRQEVLFEFVNVYFYAVGDEDQGFGRG